MLGAPYKVDAPYKDKYGNEKEYYWKHVYNVIFPTPWEKR
jgi:hypothetical protein